MIKLINHFFESIEEILTPCTYIKKRSKKKTYEVCNIPCSFDIETSSFYDKDNEKCSCMYAFVLGIGGKCVRGRSIEELKIYLNKIKEYYNLGENRRLYIYVHNLAYEFQFIRKYFEFEQVFSVDNRTPVYALTSDGFEFRCSYILSNMSLSKVAENLVLYKIKKLVGELDYLKIRTPITPLNEEEWGYILNDGLIVMAYIEELIYTEGDLTRIPLTNTGFVRNLVKEYLYQNKNCSYKNRKLIRSLTLTSDLFKTLQEAFMGGFTHANVHNLATINKNVASYDLTSSYPTVLCSEKFPMSNPIKLVALDKFEDYVDKYNSLVTVTFYDLKEKFEFDNFISGSKCLNIVGYKENNGRIVSAKKLKITLTNIDYKLIKLTYTYSKVECEKCYVYLYSSYLPKEFIECVLDLYEKKTTLKGIKDKEYEYMKSKNQLNSCYGMMVTNPCKDEIIYSEEGEWTKEEINLEEALEKYNKNPTRFLYYAWGVWTTAYARMNLWTAILFLGERYLYADTDSVKFIVSKERVDEVLSFFTQYNINITNKINKCLSYYKIDTAKANPIDKHGVHHPLGHWDYEGTYKYFKTLGAKRYIYFDENEKLHITIAGVNKINGSEYLTFKYKTPKDILLNFSNHIEFPSSYIDNGIIKSGSGKLTHTYIDIERKGEVVDYLGNKYNYNVPSAIHLEPTSYNMSLTATFIEYILEIKGDTEL